MSTAIREKALLAIIGLIAVLLSHVWTGCLVAAEPAELHVSPKGNDDNPGTVGKPFATLEGARDAIRQAGNAGKTTCTVWLQGGIHRRKQTFALEVQDSGTREHPIIYSGAKGETARLIGGTVLKPDAFTLVDNQALLERMPETARGKVYMLDLEAEGIKHMAPYPDKFTDNGGIFETFFNSVRMPVSVYPNKHGAMTIVRGITETGYNGDWHGAIRTRLAGDPGMMPFLFRTWERKP